MRTLTVTFDAREPETLATFWAEMLGRSPIREPDGVRLPGEGGQAGLRFVAGPAPERGTRGLHLHLTSTTPDEQQHTVDRALKIGASHLDVGQLPEEGHIVLADPEGNPFCVIEAGNNFLAGTGFLGEVACDGTRAVGQFWAETLGWPLVWDENEETAIQSPLGGTKVAWGGPPLAPKRGRNPQRFEVGLPAPAESGHVESGLAGSDELTDPDGNEFTLVVRRT
ncbi:VOC family protein [Catenuloplanes japonicus]|uniref:VOC family protein n=1 Tax=Catenuloplanes japonicus TaxID=33876 RepID=UPI0005249685|nr:VOC family protein [Catenuloplanes japonicus]